MVKRRDPNGSADSRDKDDNELSVRLKGRRRRSRTHHHPAREAGEQNGKRGFRRATTAKAARHATIEEYAVHGCSLHLELKSRAIFPLWSRTITLRKVLAMKTRSDPFEQSLADYRPDAKHELGINKKPKKFLDIFNGR